jgi:hypothetical protein
MWTLNHDEKLFHPGRDEIPNQATQMLSRDLVI